MKRIKLVCICMICGAVLSACGQKEETPGIVDLNPSSVSEAPHGDSEQTGGAEARDLTQEEIEFFDDYLSLSENADFLLSTYKSAGDTNLRIFDCVGGTVSGDVFTLRVQTKDAGTGYFPEYYETVLKKNGDSYQFVSNRLMEEVGKIEDQSFEITLEPWGKVTFASYMPDENGEPTADVTFRIIQDGKVLTTLKGAVNDNIRGNQCFLSVDAVSFPDFNGDGYMDLITIVSYDFASGPDAGQGYTEARIYSGNENGYFAYERGLSDAANSALAELTISSVLGFVDIGGAHTSAGGSSASGVTAGTTGTRTGMAWKDAYIEVLKNADSNEWDGFTLIYLDDDDVPELVKVGAYAARGTMLVAYTEGGVKENQLNRLFFSYIERGNQLCNSEGLMDYYYDLVFYLQDGELILTDQGYYGAEDNSNVQYDKNGEPIYQYEWNGKQVTKEEYAKALNAVYDQSKAVRCYDWNQLYSAEELIRELSR